VQNRKSRPNLALDSTVPTRPSVGIQRRPQAKFPEVGQTLSSYRYDAFQNQPPRRAHGKAVKAKKRWSKKKIALLVALPFLLIAAFLIIKFGYNLSKIFQGNVFGILSSSKLKGEDEGRVNILIAGNSADDIGHNGGNLTDSIMVLSVDTRNNKALLLSVPRDLYVDIPGYRHGKINEAYVAGESQNFHQDGYPDGGMGLLEKTIYQTLGIKSHYYALINYTALRDMVNAVGGIDVNIQSTNPRGLYDPSKDYATGGVLVNLSNGWHHLNGAEALNLARARGDAYGSYGYGNSDFTRTANQRLMLLALKSKATSSGVLTNPIKLSKLADAVGNNIKSDMKLSEVRRLYTITKDIGNNKIASAGLNDLSGNNYLASARNASGSVLIPAAGQDDFSEIQAALRRLFSNNQIVNEDAKVVVLNATNTYGIAAANKTKLVAKFVTVTAIADARATADTSTIINASKGSKPATLALLKQMYGNQVTTNNTYSARYPDADFIVLVGADKLDDYKRNL
jgi:LCP family protein required for cell wall assembly